MKKTKLKNALIMVAIPVATVLTIGVISVLGKNQFKKPSGAYSEVGSADYEITDYSRHEDATVRKDDFRRILIKIFYPAQSDGVKEKASYHPNPDVFNDNVKQLYGIPKILLSRLSKSKSNALKNVAIAQGDRKFPVLLFSHGLNGNNSQNNFQFAELASHGYVVVSIEHPFAASGTVFSDGQLGATIPFGKMKDEEFAHSLVKTWSDDQLYVLNYIETLNQDNKTRFFNRLNLDKVGVFGHSLGGATSAASLTRDNRLKVGINMDGFYFGNFYKDGFHQPFLELRSEVIPLEELSAKQLQQEYDMSREYYQYLFVDGWNERLNTYAKNGYESITIKGANHMSFSDFPLVIPFRKLIAGDVDRIHQEINKNVIDFFNKSL
ncbi:MAG: hypothetical protein RLO81_00505 [Fulvivirga sp.]|uniref:alpha/beta hydrolase family protein n=1 Tax=Fulvivirga sp. TaxID=1931237 RepID=UPI0032EC53C8